MPKKTLAMLESQVAEWKRACEARQAVIADLERWKKNHEASVEQEVGILIAENGRLWDMLRVAMNDPRIKAQAEAQASAAKDGQPVYDSFLRVTRTPPIRYN